MVKIKSFDFSYWEHVFYEFPFSVLAFLENWGFDGLDLSFEFPQINERKGFATWIKKIKEAFGTKYELTISLPANKEKIQAGRVFCF